MNRNGQGRGNGRGLGREGTGKGAGRGNRLQGEAGLGQGRRGGGFFGRGRGMGWQATSEDGARYNRPVSDFINGLGDVEKKSWLEKFKAHLTQRMSEVDEELGKF